MCSCDSGSVYEMRSSGNRTVDPGGAIIDYVNFNPPGIASIKNPAGSTLDVDLVASNSWANRWWLKFYFMFKHYAGSRTYYARPVISVLNNYGLQCFFQLIPVGSNAFSLAIITGRKYSDGPDIIESPFTGPCPPIGLPIPMFEGVWYEIIVSVKHSVGDGEWQVFVDGTSNGHHCPRTCICSCPDLIFGGETFFEPFPCEFPFSGEARPLYCCYWGHCSGLGMPDIPINSIRWISCSSTVGRLAPRTFCCEWPNYQHLTGPLDCHRPDCPCHNENDACYPRRQTRFGADNFAARLLFGNDEGGANAFDYWFDDIIFNDTAPYKHDNHAVPDGAVAQPTFGSRLTLLRVDAAGDAADFVPVGLPNNWENVDELPVSIADYNQSGALNAKDLYNLESASEVLS